METIGAYEAKTHLPQLLKRVSKGEIITITKHGVPVATLQVPAASAKRPTRDVIADLRRFRRWPGIVKYPQMMLHILIWP